jgi:coenzyme F420 biosynthesis associated uncharacterized protein
MNARPFVDWGLAQRIAVGLAGDNRAVGPFHEGAIEAACAEAATLVLEYSRLRPARPLPKPELIHRAEWARLGVRTLSELSAEPERRIAEGIRLPGPFGGMARSVAGAALAAEAGVAVGYGARKVLGQYDLPLVGEDRKPRLLFVGPNLSSAHAELGEDPALFVRWIAIHETTHAVQFSSVPWLRSHLGGLLDRLIKGASAQLDQTSMRELARRLFRADPRATIRTMLRGDLPRLLAGREQARILDQVQAAMSVIEGHAEHVMDAAAARLDPGYGRLRERLETRRGNRGGLGEVIGRLLGMELKLRQYRVGKAFCDEIVAEAGVEGLNGVWRTPDALPTVTELDRPREWLQRSQERAAAAAT